MQSLRGYRRLLAASFAAVMGLALAACETTEGFGRDVQGAGEAIERQAQ